MHLIFAIDEKIIVLVLIEKLFVPFFVFLSVLNDLFGKKKFDNDHIVVESIVQ